VQCIPPTYALWSVAGKTSDRYSLVGILAEHQGLFTAALYKQVANCLVVDFQIGERDLGDLFILYVLNLLEQFLHSQKDNAGLLRCSTVERLVLLRVTSGVHEHT